MNENTLTIVMGLVIVALVGYDIYLRYRQGQEITVPGVLEAVAEARPVALEVKEIAQLAVNAVEQARREGKITDNNIAFDKAYTMAKAWIPDEWEIPDSQLIETINGAILVASALSAQAGLSSEKTNQSKTP